MWGVCLVEKSDIQEKAACLRLKNIGDDMKIKPLYHAVIFFSPVFSTQLVFSFNEKLFGLLVKDIEAMDPSILKGEPATGKRQKVCFISDNLYEVHCTN